MLTATKDEIFCAPMAWTNDCVLPLAAEGVGENTPQGYSSKNLTAHLGRSFTNSTSALGIELTVRWEGLGSDDRARYYDPSTGRFLNEDPIGFNGGTDFYAYVYNDPTDFSDPYGLRKYKCNVFGVCSKTPFGPRSGRPTPPPAKQPCPLVSKAFNDFNRCFEDEWGEKFPGAAAGAALANMPTIADVPGPTSSGDTMPNTGGGDLSVAINAAGIAAEDAIVECLKAHPLAGLDPRFPPKNQINVGKVFSPTWWNTVTNYLGWSPPF